MKIYPSLLSIDQSKLESELNTLLDAKADALHYDVMDGKFVENTCGGIELLHRVKKISNLPINIHLMVKDVEEYIDMYLPYANAGLCFHIEAVQNPFPLLQKIKSAKISAGLVIDLPTSVNEILPYLNDVDFVLIMTVKAGYGGQKFDDYGLQKAKEIKKLFPFLPIHIDGGINLQTTKLCIGIADVLDAGSVIFNSPNYAEIIKKLR